MKSIKNVGAENKLECWTNRLVLFLYLDSVKSCYRELVWKIYFKDLILLTETCVEYY